MKKTKPKISVVMPVYSRAHLVHNAIQSILDQTFDDWELIVVDDGSTDNTVNVINMYAKQDKRIKLYKNSTNKGISYSRNKGNKMAKADIIVVQDSDDVSLPDRLEEIYKAFQEFPDTDLLYHQFYIRAIDIKYGARALHREIHKCGEYDRKRAITVPYIPGQVAYKKEKILKYPYRTKIKTWDDWMMIIDFTMHKCKFKFLEKSLYEYVITDDSVTTQSEINGLRDQDKETIKKILQKEYHLKVL